MRTCWWMMPAAGILLALAGCVTAPERIDVRVGSDRPAPVDSSRVPNPQTLEEARAELHKAYQNIQYLEQENERQAQKAAKYKRERDDYKDRLEKYEKD